LPPPAPTDHNTPSSPGRFHDCDPSFLFRPDRPSLCSPARAGADLTAKPNAYTEKDRHRECLEFNLKTLVDSYKSIGNKNPAWMPKPSSSSNPLPSIFADVGFSDMYYDKSPTWPELIELAEAAVKKGCDDPIVLYCYGAFLTESGRADDGKPVLQQAYKGLIQSKYPPSASTSRPSACSSKTQSLKDRFDISTEMDKARIRMVKSKFINAAHRRRVGDSLIAEITELPTKKQLDFYEQMVKDKKPTSGSSTSTAAAISSRPPGRPRQRLGQSGEARRLAGLRSQPRASAPGRSAHLERR